MANRQGEARIEHKRTYCKVCMTACGLIAEVEDNARILSVRADRDHPVTRGYSCPKGRATGRIYHDENAIARPLMRKDGALVEVSWDEALDDIGARLRSAIDAHGPHAVGMYFGSGLGLDSAGYAMEEAFYRALGTPPKFSPLTNDTTAKTMVSGAMAKFYGINPKTDYDACKLVLYVGTNPMVSHAHNTGMYNPGMWFKTIRKRGGEIWVIDPVRSETADFAAGHLAAWPGRDYAVLAWLVREVIADPAFAARQPVQHLDDLRDLLADYDRARAAEVAGLAEAELQGLLDAIRRHRVIAIETGTGTGMSPGGNLTVWFAWLLMVLTGSINVPGGLWLHPGALFPFDRMVDHLPLLDTPFTASSNVRPDIKGICGDWPCAVLPQEIAAGNIRALFNFGGHLLRSFPDANALAAALPQLDLMVSTEIVHNELSAFCTHILPTKASVERGEFTRWDTLNWAVSLQYAPALVQPLGERRSAWWVIAEIMRRAGLPVADHVPADDSAANDDFMQSLLLTHARCSWQELKDRGYVEFERELPAPWVDRFFARIGGWELMPEDLVAQWHRFRAEDDAALGRPRPLVFTSRRQRRKFNGQIDFLGEPADCLIHPETALAHGIADGAPMRVATDAGEIVVTARHDSGVRPGVCSIPHGHGEANVNLLTSTHAMDPLGGMAHYSAVPVAISAG